MNILGTAKRCGMPVSHDNLCQGTLDHAAENAEKLLEEKA